MNQMFTEMMKGFDPWKRWDMSKPMDMMNGSDAARMGVRLLDFQKSAFNTSFDTLLKVQEQTQKVAAVFVSSNKAISDPGKTMMEEWQKNMTTNQTLFRQYVLDQYDRLIVTMQPEK